MEADPGLRAEDGGQDDWRPCSLFGVCDDVGQSLNNLTRVLVLALSGSAHVESTIVFHGL